jgi:hypothetical protein
VILAALAVRQQQSVASRTAAMEAAVGSYRSELALAQSQVLEAQGELERFDEAQRPPLGALDQYQQGQLRLAVQDARTRITDLKARIDRAAVMAGIVLTADSLDFQVVDKPMVDAKPSGGGRPAATIAGSAMLGGLALASLLVLAGTLLASRVGAEADIARLEPATLFAAVPKISRRRRQVGRELRTALAAVAFSPSAAENRTSDG